MSRGSSSLESVSVSSVVVTDVKTAEENQSIQAVCKTMYESKIGSISKGLVQLISDGNYYHIN
jgi:6-phosphogluconate dehydrogenase